MDHFLSMDAFVRVAEVGSFAEVARQLNVSKSVVTTRVQQLEDFVGSSLFHRSTRTVRLSEVGQTYFDECAQVVSHANQVVDLMRQYRGSPRGQLRVHAIPGLVLDHMAASLMRFQARHPSISFDFVVDDMVIDPIREGFDCVLQIFAPISEDLVQKKLLPVRRIFCAAPDYLANHPPILHPLDLPSHKLGLYSRYPTKDKWTFDDGYEQIELELKPAVRSNAIHFLKEIALASGAVVCLPTIVAARHILEGRLVPILRGYRLPSYWLSAVFPKTQRNTVKLRLFLEHLARDFSENPAWDVALINQGLLPAMPDTPL
ncbi:LysR family transcriptional regulator [Duganella sp. FT92W]|uniref:LysR family transcriptional regulator n=1 Tax=Pseudoduganella rivuli TaxID=2666085 RepID=A0A7X2II46_9BURK|nr:LysR family transcriptional regulator [Pseudoduganella rivuli]MRV70459.1 LysR family transcriptional regulator [Pseudoduganella rivuli]